MNEDDSLDSETIEVYKEDSTLIESDLPESEEIIENDVFSESDVLDSINSDTNIEVIHDSYTPFELELMEVNNNQLDTLKSINTLLLVIVCIGIFKWGFKRWMS